MNRDNMKSNDDDFEMKDEYDFSNAVRGRFYSPKKVSTSIRIDDDVIMYFKRRASEEKTGYQTLMNAALREFMTHSAAKLH